MIHFIVETGSASGPASLAFDADTERLIATGEGDGPPSIVVQSFNPVRDIFYRSPGKLTPEELAEEVAVHVPHSLREIIEERFVPSPLAGLALMQLVGTACPAISPLTALAEVLRGTGSINSALLQADNGGLLFVRQAGDELRADASAHSLNEFLSLEEDERETIFPDFHASEIILSGFDLDHFEILELGPPSSSRRVAIPDFTPLCEFSSEAAALVELNPHLYTLAIGAASVYAAIWRASQG